ncbi:MAG: hypothetical protein EA367_07305 [Leptolyngbya sp. DLM2.Bin15]|nr:MAG: hypothetical protein EA367_07305 [Leptolyngbya sp. DLM2.Bin15]
MNYWLLTLRAIAFIFSAVVLVGTFGVAVLSGDWFLNILCIFYLPILALLWLLPEGQGQVTCTFDKQADRLLYQRRSLRGTTTTVVALSTVYQITLQEERPVQNYTYFPGEILYSVYLELRSSRERFTLLPANSFNMVKAQKIVWLVSDFLELPPFNLIEFVEP